MIVGNGLIAKSLVDYEKNDDVIIFASGVSNSSENNENNFEKEKSLLLSFKTYKGKLIYFSTCSIFDDSLKNTPYVLHKIKMEKLISKTFKDYIILRLPTLVGNNENPHVFFNNFKMKLKKNEPLKIYNGASRYLIAVDDISLIINRLLNFNKSSFTLNVAFNNKAKVFEIANFMKKELLSESALIIEEKGNDFEIDNSDFIKIISADNENYLSTNYEKVIKRYI